MAEHSRSWRLHPQCRVPHLDLQVHLTSLRRYWGAVFLSVLIVPSCRHKFSSPILQHSENSLSKTAPDGKPLNCGIFYKLWYFAAVDVGGNIFRCIAFLLTVTISWNRWCLEDTMRHHLPLYKMTRAFSPASNIWFFDELESSNIWASCRKSSLSVISFSPVVFYSQCHITLTWCHIQVWEKMWILYFTADDCWKFSTSIYEQRKQCALNESVKNLEAELECMSTPRPN